MTSVTTQPFDWHQWRRRSFSPPQVLESDLGGWVERVGNTLSSGIECPGFVVRACVRTCVFPCTNSGFQACTDLWKYVWWIQSLRLPVDSLVSVTSNARLILMGRAWREKQPDNTFAICGLWWRVVHGSWTVKWPSRILLKRCQITRTGRVTRHSFFFGRRRGGGGHIFIILI